MNIGFVSTWLHRGGTYVTINYAQLLTPDHKIFVYARAGEFFDETLHVDGIDVYKAPRIGHRSEVMYSDFRKWIKNNRIEMVIWNEQRELEAVCMAKNEFPTIPHGAYIDYYKEDTIKDFAVFDFLICNTKRHFSAFSWHKQAYYMPWGCDIEVYKPVRKRENEKEIVFFHSMGMSDRKGTDVLVRVFKNNRLDKYGAKLVIHSQVNMDSIITEGAAKECGIQIINKTVAAPGLYYMGDVYVYPAKLDGLGLTLYEAISCGLPVIATNVAPMNEVINNENGYLVEVDRLYCRSDGYYWPQADVNEQSLLDAMMFYINNVSKLDQISKHVRGDAVEHWNIRDRRDFLLGIVNDVRTIDNKKEQEIYLAKTKKKERTEIRTALMRIFVPKAFQSAVKSIREKSRKNKGA